MGSVILGDCLQMMPTLPSNSIDMILCDLPYGTTACAWDSLIPFEPLWAEYKRLLRANGVIVLTAQQPFSSALVMSNPSWFRYEWIWEKSMAANVFNAKKQPMKRHENVLVFYNKQPTYNPQMEVGKPYTDNRATNTRFSHNILGNRPKRVPTTNHGTRYPKSVQLFKQGNNKTLHPTQKPLALFEYLIKTYTNPNDVVLDNCAGSGTTGVAAQNLGREYVLIEQDEKYFNIINERLMEGK